MSHCLMLTSILFLFFVTLGCKSGGSSSNSSNPHIWSGTDNMANELSGQQSLDDLVVNDSKLKIGKTSESGFGMLISNPDCQKFTQDTQYWWGVIFSSNVTSFGLKKFEFTPVGNKVRMNQTIYGIHANGCNTSTCTYSLWSEDIGFEEDLTCNPDGSLSSATTQLWINSEFGLVRDTNDGSYLLFRERGIKETSQILGNYQSAGLTFNSTSQMTELANFSTILSESPALTWNYIGTTGKTVPSNQKRIYWGDFGDFKLMAQFNYDSTTHETVLEHTALAITYGGTGQFQVSQRNVSSVTDSVYFIDPSDFEPVISIK